MKYIYIICFFCTFISIEAICQNNKDFPNQYLELLFNVESCGAPHNYNISRLNNPEISKEFLLKKAKSDNLSDKAKAIILLSEFKDEDLLLFFQSNLDNENDGIVSNSIIGLQNIGSKKAIEIIGEKLNNTPYSQVEVAITLINALKHLGANESLAHLQSFKKDCIGSSKLMVFYRKLSSEAIVLLGNYQDPTKRYDFLKEKLFSEHAGENSWAFHMIHKSNDKKYLPLLRDYCDYLVELSKSSGYYKKALLLRKKMGDEKFKNGELENLENILKEQEISNKTLLETEEYILKNKHNTHKH